VTPYDPSVSGAVAVVSFREDEANPASGGLGNAAGPAVHQDGAVYVAFTHHTGTNTNWETQSHEWLRPSRFCRIGPDAARLWDCSQRPDFSEAGSPFSVGFARWNSCGPNGYSITSGTDNWQVTLIPWTPLFADDFEAGNLAAWSGVSQ
jgi:hypothetical protein